MWNHSKAHANIALIKYWGKRDHALNLPETGSLSMTLEALHTRTKIRLSENLNSDKVTLNNIELDEQSKKAIVHFLRLVRDLSGSSLKAEIISENNFPTASGLASSASGYAALAKAASMAYGLELGDKELSILARRGSGSAARSIFGGLVEMLPGVQSDGTDAFAQKVPSQYNDLTMIICIVGGGKKKAISSRDAMNLCKSTSPYYAPWVEQVPKDLSKCKALLLEDDFEALGSLVEANALAMHATAMASRPSTLFFEAQTLALLKRVTDIRKEGTLAFATMDAGPHVKVLCRQHDSSSIEANIKRDFSSIQTIVSRMGPGAQSIEA